MPRVQVGDINMYYEVRGTGQSFIFINGLGSNSMVVSRHVPVFAQQYQVITFDNRGTGRSDVPAVPYTMDMMADDLAGLMDAIGVATAGLCGTSMGGMIAQTFALRYPGRVNALVLVSTHCGGPHSLPSSDEEYLKNAADTTRMAQMTPKQRFQELFTFIMTRDFISANQGMLDEYLDDILRFPTPPQGMAGQARAIANFDTYERLSEIQTPTLIAHGGADRLTPVENAHLLASKIPGAELRVFEGLGHNFWFEAFDEFNAIVFDFLRRHGLQSA